VRWQVEIKVLLLGINGGVKMGVADGDGEIHEVH
jgi:hypothetical protein